MYIKISALDTLFFRDAKPFDNNADGTSFPPSPSVIYGAMRTAYFLQNPDSIVLMNTENDPTSNLKIEAIYLCDQDNILYLKSPRTYIEKEEKLVALQEIEANNLYSNFGDDNATTSATRHIYSTDNKSKTKNSNQDYIAVSNLLNYLEGKNNEYEMYNLNKYLLKENKVGNMGNPDIGIVEEGQLYSISSTRCEQIVISDKRTTQSKTLSILIKINNVLQYPNVFYNKLGGESKLAKFEILNDFDIELNNIINEANREYNIYIQTPCIIESRVPKALSLYFDIIDIIQDRNEYIGGWDMALNQPKKMQQCLPAGTIIFVKLKNNKTITDFKTTYPYSISDDLSKQGFGIYIIGNK